MPSDYARIEKIIQYLDENHQQQPSLEELAALVDLSPSYFQRLFTRWAGVSPKKYLQFLTASYAREWLRESESVMDAALETGLSGTGRLHDLTLQLFGATPGEMKRHGEGMTLSYGIYDSPFGSALLVEAPRGLSVLRFIDPSDFEKEMADIQKDWAAAIFIHRPERIAELGQTVFGENPEETTVPLFVRGTPFQLKVWEALIRVPEGALTTYGRLAEAIGNPAANRAVGTAVGNNPVAYLIPCHRVIRQSGAFNQYRWGRDRKMAMLGWEAARIREL